MREITEWTPVRFLGRGSSATVSLAAASSSSHSEFFAVKSSELSRSLPLRNEHIILSSLAPSPHVISYLGCHVSPSTFSLFLEYAPQGPINRNVSSTDSVPARTCEILRGLSHLHSRGIAHFDVKPDNILIGSDNRVKLADFGCARFAQHEPDSDHVSGTPAFMAPEVVRAERRGPAADIWALGCTAIELLTGSPVWKEASDPVEILYRVGFCDAVPETPKWVSDECRDFLGKCFVRDPMERWTADQLLTHPFMASGTGSGLHLDPIGRVSPWSVLDPPPVLRDSLMEVDDVAGAESVGDDVGVRIGQLADRDWVDWTWDDDWTTARTNGEEFDVPDGSDGGQIDEVGADVEFSGNSFILGFRSGPAFVSERDEELNANMDCKWDVEVGKPKIICCDYFFSIMRFVLLAFFKIMSCSCSLIAQSLSKE